MNQRVITFITTLLLSAAVCTAYNLRQSSNVDGLQNSAILSMQVDKDGLLWAGTCDGVSIADGLNIISFSDMYPELSLSGSLIEHITHAPDGLTWIQTNHGLDRFRRSDCSVTSFPQYKGDELIYPFADGGLILLTTKGGLYRLTNDDSGFEHMTDLTQRFENILSMSIRGDSVIVVDTDGVSVYPPDADGRYSADRAERTINRKFIFSTAREIDIWAVTSNHILGKITRDGHFVPVMDISGPIADHGAIADVMTDRLGNIHIAFSTSGVIRIRTNHKGDHVFEEIGPNVGVFCLESSPVQDVIWIGSDCQGIYTVSESDYTINSVTFADLDRIIRHPIRAIYLDSDSTLWLGTKGSGILCIDKFHDNNPSTHYPSKRLLTSSNAQLHDNTVFAFAKGAGGRLWIGSGKGLSYYDRRSRQIHKIPENPLLRYIYDIYEPDDTTLIVATLGQGVVKAHIDSSTGKPVLTDMKQLTVDGGERASNFFFSISDILGQGIILCNRGLGAFKLEQDSLVRIPLKDTYDTKSVNDLFTAVGDSRNLWLGTGHGLIRMHDGKETLYSGSSHGFASNTIHDILTDRNGDLWISTNKGLVRFRPTTEDLQTYTRDYGLDVSEFSDGAAFATDNSLIFGGVDGLVVVTFSGHMTGETSVDYQPQIHIHSLHVKGEDTALSKHITYSGGIPTLRLNHDQNLFSVTFFAPDFIDAANYSYFYSIDNSPWINNGSNRTISFNELGYGTYRLAVKYINRTTGVESAPYVLMVKIAAPWHLSITAYIIYAILIIAAVILIITYLMNRQKVRQRDELKLMDLTHKEQVYEEKLRFFTNITHEFSTPLTLIYGPCERILTYAGTDDYIKRYVNLIRINAERLNNLIQELIDFRRMETGHKVLKIHSIDISSLCRDTLVAYAELAESHQIDLRSDIPDDINWNSDFGCLRKILNNLISNAFKYTPTGGIIELEVKIEEGRLVISVYNTGKGISDEDKERIFNRYAVLDNVEESAVKGLRRNGLGLAICHSIVETLRGTITIESVVNKYAKFVVTLPPIARSANTPETVKDPADDTYVTIANIGEEDVAPSQKNKTRRADTDRPAILVIDDNQEILNLLSDSLTNYDVITAPSADEGLQLITRRQPDLIITDVMMPGTDGFELTRQIKSNIHTRYIPLVILSAKSSTKEQIDGLESGADVYIGKPFSISYLQAVVKRLIEGREYLRQYYNSSASAYQYNDGRLLASEDRDIMEKVTSYIDTHIDDEKLSPESLADHLQISLRNLYRKFKDLDLPAPNDFIKNQRMAVAARLLVTTTDTVQEIMYHTGFTNRSHFYKEFGRRYGMTPGDYRAQNRHIDNSLTDNK